MIDPRHIEVGVTIYCGDCREVMPHLPDASIDSVVTDPPYHLTTNKKGGTGAASLNLDSPAGRSRVTTGFMGKAWDGGDVAHDPAVWRECLRLLKPGGHLLAFGGTRTYHRLACAIEDAGFEIRDQIQWIYGSGFPKSLNLDGGIGTGLKPAHEPIVLARKPLVGTVKTNIAEFGTGGLNIDSCRIDWEGEPPEIGTPSWGGPHKTVSAVPGQNGDTAERLPPSPLGRWPANVIHDGSDEVLAGFPETASGVMKAGTVRAATDHPGSVCYGTYGGNATDVDTLGDSGSAARFFYCAKATQEDRNEGCEDLPFRVADPTHKRPRTELDDPRRHGVTPRQNHHPTVKPTALIRYLIRLITPIGGIVLDPFCGSGSTGKAAGLEHCKAILIDSEAEYCDLAAARSRLPQGLLAFEKPA